MVDGPGSCDPGTNINLLFSAMLGNSKTRSINEWKLSEIKQKKINYPCTYTAVNNNCRDVYASLQQYKFIVLAG